MYNKPYTTGTHQNTNIGTNLKPNTDNNLR